MCPAGRASEVSLTCEGDFGELRRLHQKECGHDGINQNRGSYDWIWPRSGSRTSGARAEPILTPGPERRHECRPECGDRRSCENEIVHADRRQGKVLHEPLPCG